MITILSLLYVLYFYTNTYTGLPNRLMRDFRFMFLFYTEWLKFLAVTTILFLIFSIHEPLYTVSISLIHTFSLISLLYVLEHKTEMTNNFTKGLAFIFLSILFHLWIC